ncbi:MAG: Flp pilus assembly protein CpaB [Acidimicrobiia bacterium]|nr:Flp pilus assembly protein CpaB [Acidimicrobiia bacterium]
MDRQKLLTIFGIAWVSAALLTWFLYARTKAPKTEKTVDVVAAMRDMPAGTKLAKADLKLVKLLEKDIPKGALSGAQEAIGRALLYPVNENEPVTATRLASLTGVDGVAATIEPGMRAVSVAFTDASGASGLIQPRSHVDVLFTKTGNPVEALTVNLLEDVVVLSVGRTTEIQQPGAAGAAKANVTRPTNQTATLMVTPEQAKKLELAKNQGKISLALRNPMDRSTQQNTSPALIEEIEPMLLSRSARRGLAARPPVNLKDRAEWAKLTGEEPKPEPKKEPPKPKLVVDVYRGDKHVQEIFQ